MTTVSLNRILNQLDYDNDSAILGIGFSGDACDDDDDNDGVLDTT